MWRMKTFDEHIDEIGRYHVERLSRPEPPDPLFPTTRVGIIGFGRWGTLLAARFSSICDVRVTALCSRGETPRAQARRLYPRAAVYPRHQELVDDGNVDVVVIATPVASHFSIARDALESGKPIFLEKPMTAELDEAEELRSLSRSRRVKLMVDHSALFEEAGQRLKGYLGDGRYGEPTAFACWRGRPGAEKYRGAVETLGVHDFALLDHLTERLPVQVRARCAAYEDDCDAETDVELTYADGLQARLHLDLRDAAKRARRSTLDCARTRIVWDEARDPKLVIRHDNRLFVPTLTRARDALLEAAVSFLAAVHRDEPMVSDAAMGVRTMQIVDACRRSLATGRACEIRSPDRESAPLSRRSWPPTHPAEAR
jgi:predicted dehydrogenase